jgi:hypothetical protein
MRLVMHLKHPKNGQEEERKHFRRPERHATASVGDGGGGKVAPPKLEKGGRKGVRRGDGGGAGLHE